MATQSRSFNNQFSSLQMLPNAQLVKLLQTLSSVSLVIRAIICLRFMSEATCYGGSNTSPNYGFWRTGILSDKYIPCFVEAACLGGNVTQPLTMCATGYNGILCSQCDGGYFKSDDNKCQKCPLWLGSFVKLLVQFTVITIIALYFLRSLMQNLAAGSKPVTYVYFKILISHFQQMGLVATIKFQWDTGTSIIMTILQVIADAPMEILFPQCLLQDVTGINGGNDSAISIFYLKVVSAGVMPLLVCAILASIFYIKEKKSKDENKSPTAFRD